MPDRNSKSGSWPGTTFRASGDGRPSVVSATPKSVISPRSLASAISWTNRAAGAKPSAKRLLADTIVFANAARKTSPHSKTASAPGAPLEDHTTTAVEDLYPPPCGFRGGQLGG